MAKGISEKQKKIILIALASVTVLYIDLAYILKPQIGKLKKVSSELSQSAKAFSQYKKGSTQIQALKSSLSSLKGKQGASENKIFSESELTALLDDISMKALDSGIKIMQITPQGTSLDMEKEVVEGAGLRLLPLMLKLEISCGYHQLGGFLSRIESNPLISTPELKITVHSSYPAQQKVELTFKIYVSRK